MKKGIFLNIENVVSIINKTKISGIYRFDSFEKLDNKETCYVTKKLNSGFNYLVKVEEIKDSIIPKDKLKEFGITLSKREIQELYGK